MSIKTGIIDPDLALNIVRNSPVIAFDSETTGLTVRDIVCGWVITDWDHSVYVPVRHDGGGNIPDVGDFEKELADAFKDRSRKGLRTVGHHLGFDLRAAGRHGVIPWSPLEDTMINESLIDDLTKGYSLDECCKRHGVEAKKGDAIYRAMSERFGGIPDKKQMQHFYKMPGDMFEVVDYATGDGVSTLHLWKSQQPILDEEELRKPWKLECDLLPYLARMHLRGIRVDGEAAEQVRDQFAANLREAEAQFPAGFNPRSPKEVEGLFRAQGFGDDDFVYTNPTPNKPEGQISFREQWLKTNPLGEAILTIRRLKKAEESFISPLTDEHNVNGRVHAILNQSKSDEFGVAGARLSCSEPNLQAYPKRNKAIGKPVRRLIAADPGMILDEADFKQQEPRFFTHYSEEPALIEGYNTGTMDIHDVADSYFHLGRDVSKRLGLGILTGMQPRALAGHMSWPLSEAERAHRKFLGDAFPNIGQFQKDAKSVFKNRGYVKSILGRKARLDQARFAYRAVSRIIQNSGGDHMKTALLRVNEYEDAHPDVFQALMTIHDSNIWQRDPGHDISEIVRVIENVAQEPDFSLIVPIPVDVGTGYDWSEASYGK